jgi:hypothetical protein
VGVGDTERESVQLEARVIATARPTADAIRIEAIDLGPERIGKAYSQ